MFRRSYGCLVYRNVVGLGGAESGGDLVDGDGRELAAVRDALELVLQAVVLRSDQIRSYALAIPGIRCPPVPHRRA